ncbi:hypothetical protein EPN96_08770 [bacterium]|nr:MAG: hypothetical protein EPN96_08770 [bacterium]
MSSAVQNIKVLNNNPFILTALIPAFYSTVESRVNNFVLAYLVFPLVLPSQSRRFLINIRNNSSLHTLARNRKNIYGLQERVANYRKLTNACIQYSVDSELISVENDLSVSFKKNFSDDICPENSIKAAKNLGKLLGKFDIPTVYRRLGVKEL